jgi:NAD(P)-dependent dehydrogenase (short-subunit alcohol dehydrogenase family)
MSSAARATTASIQTLSRACRLLSGTPAAAAASLRSTMPAPRLGGSTALVTATTLNTFTSNWRRNHETVVSGHMALFGTPKDVQTRQRRNGHIFFVTSMGGLCTFPGLSAYHGSKFALEGIAATIAQEVAPSGIHVTAVESSSFRTDWAGRSMTRVRRTITDTSTRQRRPSLRRQGTSRV